jgi:hypothetical protein
MNGHLSTLKYLFKAELLNNEDVDDKTQHLFLIKYDKMDDVQFLFKYDVKINLKMKNVLIELIKAFGV